VEQLRGDRDDDLSSLRGRSWDAVIDTSGFVPRVVRASAQLLTSTTEREVEAAFDQRSLIVRPGLIVGRHDPTERFTYWVRRLAEGGQVLAPRATEQPVQFIDVRDLSEWIIAMVERGAAGIYNATGPAEPLTFTRMLEQMQAVTGPSAALRWIDEDRLAEADVEPWEDLPLWLDLARHAEFAGFLGVDISRAMANGLTLRPLETTAADTLDWGRQNPAPVVKRFGKPVPVPGLEPARERQLLSALDRAASSAPG
jgi:2'-hydroxyisoflavone reductase